MKTIAARTRRRHHGPTKKPTHLLACALGALACILPASAALASTASAEGLLWSPVTEMAVPPALVEALPPTNPSGAGLLSISCPADGSCAAVGDAGTAVFGAIGLAGPESGAFLTISFLSGGQEVLPIAVSQQGGAWATPEMVAPPAGGEPLKTALTSISCAEPDSCMAVGDYIDKASGKSRGMVVSYTGGQWSHATAEPVVPSEEGSPLVLSSVSCPAGGGCTAVGIVLKGSGEPSTQVVAVSQEPGGRWGAPEPIFTPTSTSILVPVSISCAASESCTVLLSPFSSTQPSLALTENGGHWESPQPFEPPIAVSGESFLVLNSVSCITPESCSAVGVAEYGVTKSGSTETVVVPVASTKEAGGHWSRTEALSPPAPTTALKTLMSVSCYAPGSCLAGGLSATSIPLGHIATTIESAGKWGALEEVPQSPDGATLSAFSGISCTQAGGCTAVGLGLSEGGSGNAKISPIVAFATHKLQLPETMLPSGQVGIPYHAQLSATGGTGDFQWTIPSGSLPSGLTLDPATGVISGTPTTAESSSFVLELADNGLPEQIALRAERITIAAAPTPEATTPVPQIKILSSKLGAAKGKLKVKLSCKITACEGTVKVTETFKRKTKAKSKGTHKGKGKAHTAGHSVSHIAFAASEAASKSKAKSNKRKAHAKRKTIVLATGHYTIAAGSTTTIAVELTAKGKHALHRLSKAAKQAKAKGKHHAKRHHHHAKGSRHHTKTLKAKLTVTVVGGKPAHKAVKVS